MYQYACTCKFICLSVYCQFFTYFYMLFNTLLTYCTYPLITLILLFFTVIYSYYSTSCNIFLIILSLLFHVILALCETPFPSSSLWFSSFLFFLSRVLPLSSAIITLFPFFLSYLFTQYIICPLPLDSNSEYYLHIILLSYKIIICIVLGSVVELA